MVSGQRVFNAASALALLVRIASEDPPSITDVMPAAPAPLVRFLDKALQRKLELRFQTADEMESAITELIFELEAGEAPTVHDVMAETLPGPSSIPGDGNETIRTDSLEDVTLKPQTFDQFDETMPEEHLDLAPQQRVSVVVADLSPLGEDRDEAALLFKDDIESQGGGMLSVRGGVAVGVFGAVQSVGDEPVRAVRAGVQSIGLIGRVMPEDTIEGDIRVAVACGVMPAPGGASTGPDAIEHACALLEYAEPGEIIVDDETLERARAIITAKSRGPNVNVVVDAANKPSAMASEPQREHVAPLIGRDIPLAQLVEAAAGAAKNRNPTCMLVTGPPGMGKSRLVEEFQRALDERNMPATVVAGRADLATRAVPFSVFADALRRRGVVRGGEALDTVNGKLERIVPANVPTTLREQTRQELARLMGSPLQVERAATEPEPPAAGAVGDRTLTMRTRGTLLDVFKGYATEAPLVLVLDDMQWADPPSLNVVLGLLKCEDLPVTIVVAGRSELMSGHAETISAMVETNRAMRIDLGPLEPESVRTMARALCGLAIDDGVLAQLMRRTGGNPYYLEETILAMATERVDGNTTERELSIGRRLDSVPQSVHAVIQARINKLPDEARIVLEMASIFGIHFWDQGLVALGATNLKPQLELLRERDFIEPRETSRYSGAREFGIRSGLLRDVAYALVTNDRRIDLHRRAAEWLENAGELDSLFLARHYVPAGLIARALAAFVDGGRRALQNGDAKGAVSIAQEGLDIANTATATSDRLALLIVKQDALELLGQYATALKSVEIMETLDPSEQNKWRSEARRAALMLLRGDSSAALRKYKDALDRKDGDNQEAAWLSVGLGDALQERGDTMSACAQYQRGYAAGKQFQDTKLTAQCVLRLGRVAYSTADLGQAVRLYDDAKTRFVDRLSDRRGEADAWLGLGACFAMAGDLDKAMHALGKASAGFEVGPDKKGLLVTRAYVAMALYEANEPKRCQAELEALAKLTPTSQSRHPQLLAGLITLRAMLDGGRDQTAADYARQMFESAVRSLPRFVVPIESAMGLALARTGDIETGLRHAEAAVARLESQKASEDDDPQRAYAQYAEALELAGQGVRSKQIWIQAATTMTEVESRLDEPLRGTFRRRPINHRILRKTGTPTPPRSSSIS